MKDEFVPAQSEMKYDDVPCSRSFYTLLARTISSVSLRQALLISGTHIRLKDKDTLLSSIAKVSGADQKIKTIKSFRYLISFLVKY